MGAAESTQEGGKPDSSSWMSGGCCTNMSKQSMHGSSANGRNHPPIHASRAGTNRVRSPRGQTEVDDDLRRLFQLSENSQAALLDVYLEQKGPSFNLNAHDEEGDTALHVAARNGKIQSCKILLRRGAELLPNSQGQTPCDVAVINGHTYCASLLRAKMEGTVDSKFATQNSSTSSTNNPRINGHEAPWDSTMSSPPPHGAPHSLGPGNYAASPQGGQIGAPQMLAVAMYNYGASDDLPFPPDERPEFQLVKNEQLELLYMREDGWCIVRRPNDGREGFAPGNYLTSNGRDSLVKQFITGGDSRSLINNAYSNGDRSSGKPGEYV